MYVNCMMRFQWPGPVQDHHPGAGSRRSWFQHRGRSWEPAWGPPYLREECVHQGGRGRERPAQTWRPDSVC